MVTCPRRHRLPIYGDSGIKEAYSRRVGLTIPDPEALVHAGIADMDAIADGCTPDSPLAPSRRSNLGAARLKGLPTWGFA
jgi:hypothetical protein